MLFIFILSVLDGVQSQSCLTPWGLPCPSRSPGACANPFIKSMMPSKHLILSRSLLLLPSIFPSIRVFPLSQLFTLGGQNIGASASASVLPMNIQDWFSLGLTDWFDLLVVYRTLKSLLQHHSSKASILQHSAFFIVQLSHPYVTTGKTIALTRQTFVGKVISLLLNMLSRFVLLFFQGASVF